MRGIVRLTRQKLEQLAPLASVMRFAITNRSYFMRSGSGAVISETGSIVPSSLCAHRFARNSGVSRPAVGRASPATRSGTRDMSGTRVAENGGSVVPFNLADIGEGITEVEIIKWFVEVGDQIKAFDRVCEVQSDKATVEISSRYDGEVVKVYTPVGGMANVGKPLIDIRKPASATSTPSSSADAASPPSLSAPQPASQTAPAHKMSAQEGAMVAPADALQDSAHTRSLATPAVRAIAKAKKIDISKVQGSGKSGRVMKEDILRVLGGQRFDRVSLDPPSHAAHTVDKINAASNGMSIDVSSSLPLPLPPPPSSPSTPESVPGKPSKVLYLRNLPEEITELEIRAVAARYGDVHRILHISRNRQAFVEFKSFEESAHMLQQSQTTPIRLGTRFISAQYSNKPEITTSEREGAVESSAFKTNVKSDTVVPVRGYMRAMIKTMQAQTAVPHLVFSDEYHMDALIQLRQRLQAQQGGGVKLTYLPFLIKALSIALMDFPEINATFSENQESVIQRSAHNVGIAVDSPNGLVVPNIKHVETLSIAQIAQELARLSELARTNKLPQQDLTGGSITLSNIGSIGGTYMSPILVPGEAVIGAMGAMQKVPRYAADGSLGPQTMLTMSWAADHRLLAGATVARFSNRFKALIQDPALMLVALR